VLGVGGIRIGSVSRDCGGVLKEWVLDVGCLRVRGGGRCFGWLGCRFRILGGFGWRRGLAILLVFGLGW
jgi:hypothetical protein